MTLLHIFWILMSLVISFFPSAHRAVCSQHESLATVPELKRWYFLFYPQSQLCGCAACAATMAWLPTPLRLLPLKVCVENIVTAHAQEPPGVAVDPRGNLGRCDARNTEFWGFSQYVQVWKKPEGLNR